MKDFNNSNDKDYEATMTVGAAEGEKIAGSLKDLKDGKNSLHANVAIQKEVSVSQSTDNSDNINILKQRSNETISSLSSDDSFDPLQP